MKRYLYLTHRWLGITLCLFMAMWFFSGVVMIYVGYPKLTTAERLSRLPALASGDYVELATVLRAADFESPPKAIRLTTVAGSPRYVLSGGKDHYVAVDARSGQRIDSVSTADAAAAASAFASVAPGEYLGAVQEDAWTHSKAMDGHRPLHVMQMHDASATRLYVSSTTGEVVRDATGVERAWNWAGAWIHWLYPFRGGAVDKYWTDIVIYTSLIATLLAMTGLVVGIWRWRFSGKYKNASHSPYREPLMRWHHIIGLVFGTLAITWIFSGLMSMNPWKVFSSGREPLDEAAFSGGVLEASNFPLDLNTQLQRLHATGFVARELEWRMFDGAGYLVAFDAAGRTRLLSPSTTEVPLTSLPREQLTAAGAKLIAGASTREQQWLQQYDFFYYGREPHTMSGHAEKRLPVLRLKFSDEHDTWVHIDPFTAQVINVSDTHRRVDRVLFAFLHSWDWLPLLQRRPVWDVLLVLGSAGGLAISITGIVIGWRRLRFKQRRQALVASASRKSHA